VAPPTTRFAVLIKMNRSSAIFLLMTALVFEGACGFAASPAKDAYELYRSGNTNRQQACIERLVSMSDEGLPYLDKLLAIEEESPSGGQRLLIDGVVRIGTEKAADVLMARAQRYRSRIGYGDVTPVLANALARMGNKGLSRLLILSKQTESYREPWFALEWRAEMFIWFPKKQWRPTHAAGAARAAVAAVSDPAAIPTLVALIDSPELRDSALLALATMKTGGGEGKALKSWERDRNPLALKYLLAVDREKHLPLLRDKLQLLDDRIAQQRNGGNWAKARDGDWIIKVVFDLGGDRVANATLKRFVESRVWDHPHQGIPVAFAVLALGISRDPDVKQTLLGLLRDSAVVTVDNGHAYGFPYIYMGSGQEGTPMSMVAVKALQALGDPSVIPMIEQHASMVLPVLEQSEANKHVCRRFFEDVLTTLRAEEEANQAPEDTARKLADPQH